MDEGKLEKTMYTWLYRRKAIWFFT